MELKKYQKATEEFAIYPRPEGFEWLYPVTSLGEEAGEVQGKFAKAVRDCNGFIDEDRKTEIKKELGDVLWMISQICNECGFDMEELTDMNIAKLSSRKQRNVLNGNGDNR